MPVKSTKPKTATPVAVAEEAAVKPKRARAAKLAAEAPADAAPKAARTRKPTATASSAPVPTADPSLPLDEVRTEAYLIWLGEGQPHGRDEAHWIMAEEIVRTRLSGAPALMAAE